MQLKLGMSEQDARLMDDKEVFLKLITDKPQDAQRHLRNLDSYGPDFEKALNNLDLTSPLRTAGMAMIEQTTPQSINLEQLYELQNKSGIDGFDVFKPETSNPKPDSILSRSHGLFQVNDYYQGEENQKLVWGKYVDPSLMTPEENIEYAAKLKNKEGWKRWTTHRKDLHKPFLGMSNDEISSEYSIDKEYLETIDKYFGADSSVAKAVMIAESSGNVDSMETIYVPSINAPVAENSENFKYKNGKKLTRGVSELLGINFEEVPTSVKMDSIATKITEDEDALKEEGLSYKDNYLWNDTKIKDNLDTSLGIQLQKKLKTEETSQDELGLSNISVQMTPAQRLAAIRNSGEETSIVQKMFLGTLRKTGLSETSGYEGLKAANKLVRLNLEKEIQEDPALLAYSLFMQDKQEANSFFDVLSKEGETWGYLRDLAIQSTPSIITTLVGVWNALTIKNPTLYAATSSYMFTLQAGNSFDEIFSDLMEKEVKEGTLSEEEALGIATGTWVTVGTVNTVLEQMRIPQIAKAYGASIPKSKLYRKIFQKFSKDKKKWSDPIGFKNAKYRGAGLQIPKQMIIESVEEAFQGINERFQVASQLGKIRPEQSFEDVLNSSLITTDMLGGAAGGAIFGGLGAGLRLKAIKNKRRAQKEEFDFDVEQEADKKSGKNYLAGQSAGLESSKNVTSEDYVESMTFVSYLQNIVSGNAPDLKKFKNINTKNKASNLIKNIAKEGSSDLGKQVLNIIQKNGEGLGILDELSDGEKNTAMVLARAYIKRKIQPLISTNSNSENEDDSLNLRIDEMIGLIASGDLTWEKGEIVSKDLEGGGKKSKVRVLAKPGSKGQKFLEKLVNQKLEEEKALLSVKHEGNEERIESGIKKLSSELQNQLGIKSEDKAIKQSDDKLNKAIKQSEEKIINKGSKSQQEAYNEYAASVGNNLKNKKPYKPSGENIIRAKAIEKIKKMDDSVKELSRLSATDLNKTLLLFPDYVKNNPKIKKTKNGKISYSAKNKKVIAQVISDSISKPQSEKPKAPTSNKKIDISKLPRANKMTAKELAEMTGVSTKDLVSKEDIKPTKEKVKEAKRQSSRRNKYDDEMASSSLPDNDLINKLKERAGKNKSKSTSLENQFKDLSSLAKALIASDFEGTLSERINSLLSTDAEYQDESKRKFMVDRLMQTVIRKYGSEENFLNKIEDYNKTYQEASDDERSPFAEAAREILKGFQALLKTDLNRFSMNPLPSSDFVKASKHFQAAWTNFKKGYESIGVSEEDLFKRFYNGVMKALRKLKKKVGNVKVLMDWFTKWAKGTMPQANLNQRRFFTESLDVGLFGESLYKPMSNDFQKYTEEFIDFIDYDTEEGLNNKVPDTYDDKIEQVKRDGEGLVKQAISFQNLLEESSGEKLRTTDINDIRWDIFTRGQNTWKKVNNDYVKEASFETMPIQEFYDYIQESFNVSVAFQGEDAEESSVRNINIVNAYYLNIINSINRGDSIEFNLMNVEVDEDGKQKITKQGNKQLHTENSHSPITDETKSDFIIANFLQASPLMKDRVATLSKNSIYNVRHKPSFKKNPYSTEGDGSFDSSKLIVMEDEFYNLDLNTLNQLNFELAVNFRKFPKVSRPAFMVASKGGKAQSIIIGIATEDDVAIGRSLDMTNAFFDSEFEEGNITESQAKELKDDANTARGDSVELAVGIVGRYRWIQATHGTRGMHEELGVPLKVHFKRYSGEFFDGIAPFGTNDFTWLHFDFRNTYAVSDITKKTFPLMNEEEKYIWDGIKPTSSSYFEQVSAVIGRYPEIGKEDNLPGWVKQFDRIMSDDNKDYMQAKGLNSLAPEGITVYEYADKESRTPSNNDKVVWKTVKNENGNVEILSGQNESISEVYSNEERKISQGEKYDAPNKVYTISTGDIRILQNANYFSKGAATSPFQWFDQMQDIKSVNPLISPIYEKILQAVKLDQKEYYKNIERMRKDPNVLALWLKSLDNNMSVRKSNLMKMVDILEPGAYGILKHSHNSAPLVNMIKNRFIIDGAFSGRVKSRKSTRHSKFQTGNYNHVIPDFHGILEPHEFGATPFDPSWNAIETMYLKGKDKTKWNKLGRTVKGRAEQVTILNEYLETNPIDANLDTWQQLFRSPIQHFTNPHILKVRHFLGHQYGDVVFVHESLMSKMELDFDGDAVTGRKWNKDITKDLIDLQWDKVGKNNYEYSEQYKLQSYEIPLDAFADPSSEFTPTTVNTISEIANNFSTGTQVGLVQNARGMRSSLNEKGFELEFDGDFYKDVILKPRKIDEIVVMDYAPLKEGYVPTQGDSVVNIDGINYLQTTSDRELAIIQQASFDESKKGLLAFWWNSLNKKQSSIGSIDNFSAFVRSRVFRIVDKETGREYNRGNPEAQKLIKMIVNHFKVSDIRQGKNSDQQYMGAEELIQESKKVHDRINASLSEQIQDIKSLKLPKRKITGSFAENQMYQFMQEKRPQKPLVISNVIFNNLNEKTGKPIVTYLEDTVSMLWNHMVVNGLADAKNYIQYTENQQSNARQEAMEEIVGNYDEPGKLQKLVEKYELTPNDISVGKRFARKMNKAFYMAMQVTNEQNKIIDEISISTSKIDYDDVFDALEKEWLPKYLTMSENAKFVSTLEFFSGTSTNKDMIPATTLLEFQQLVTDNISESGQIRRYKIDFVKTTKSHTDMISQLIEYAEKINKELTEEGEYGFIRAKRGLAGADFKTEAEYANFFRMKKSTDSSYQELIDFKETIDRLQNKVDAIKEEIANKRGKNTIASTSRLDRNRAVNKFLPTAFLEPRFMKMFSKEWYKAVQNANDDDPIAGMDIKLATWLDSDYKVLEKKGDCKIPK